MKPSYCAEVLGYPVEMFFKIYTGEINKEKKLTLTKLWADVK